jgi:hypothetical protein
VVASHEYRVSAGMLAWHGWLALQRQARVQFGWNAAVHVSRMAPPLGMIAELGHFDSVTVDCVPQHRPGVNVLGCSMMTSLAHVARTARHAIIEEGGVP